MTNEELCKALRKPWFTNGCEKYQLEAADQIEALVKERDELSAAIADAEEGGLCSGGNLWRFWSNQAREAAERNRTMKSRAEAAEATLKEAVGLLADAMVQLSEGKIKTRRNRALLIHSFLSKLGSQT